MTRCSECNADNRDEARFCEACGAWVGASCPACGAATSPRARFCPACGTSLVPPSRKAPAAGVALPKDWAEIKQATVLFADLVSSTEMVATLDPEQAMERLKPALEAMCAAVRRFEGTVLRTLGDGIMAVFGAPRAHEGHALLACEAALAIRQSFAHEPGAGLSVRLGLHSGELVSDPTSTHPNAERAVHGLTIHLASRVPAMAPPGGIAITEETFRLVRPYCDVQPLGLRRLKGIPEAVELFALQRIKQDAATLAFRAAHMSTLRGRDREMALLQQALRRTEQGQASAIGVVGAAGMGKSRLCHDFARWCRGRLIPVFEARAQLYGHATPLQPVLEFLRSHYFGIGPGGDPAAARARISERMLAISQTFAADLPLLHDFLGVGVGETPHIAPRTRHHRLLDIVRHLVRYSGNDISLILIEDLHWLDEASEDFIATLIEAVNGTRTMVVLNYRPSYSAQWMQWPHFQEIVLGELTRGQTDELVRELLGSRPELRAIAERVAERCGGNPFFAEELVRSLAENGVLAGEPGNHFPGANSQATALPATVQAVIAARIDRLGDREKRLLQICGVIGKEVPRGILDRVAQGEVDELEGGLNELCAAQLLEPRSADTGPVYTIRHPLIQEVAYLTQLKARRQPLHAAVARAIEHEYHDRLDEFAGLLAYHYGAAGDAGLAARHAARAAMWVGSMQPAQAIKHWSQVRELLQDEGGSPEYAGLRIMASAQISWLGWREGLTAEQARPYLEEALRAAEGNDDSMVPLVLIAEGRILVASGGSADGYVERVQQALSRVPPQDEGRLATVYASLSHAYGWAGLLREGLAANDAAMGRLESISGFDNQFLGYSVEHWTLSLRGRLLARLGLLEEARRFLDRMLALEGALVDPTVQFISNLGYIDIATFTSDAALAREHADRVSAIAQRHASPYLRVFEAFCKGTASRLAGDIANAGAAFEEGLACLRSTRAAMESEPEFLASLAECRLEAGDPAASLALCAEAIGLSLNRAARLPECRASIVQAAALAAQGSADSALARRAWARAEQLIQETGVRIFEPLIERHGLRVAGAGAIRASVPGS
jgi:adenylate cyclase